VRSRFRSLLSSYLNSDLPYILGAAQRQNVASIRVLEKLGMTFDREARHQGGRATIFREVPMDVYKIVKPL
jgi:hypothetical protein